MSTQSAEKTPEKKSIKPSSNTGESIATAGFAIALASIFTNFFSFGLMAVAGLVLSIVGRVQTKRAGRPSNLALAGIIISGVVMFLTLVTFILFFVLLINAGSKHQIDCDSPKYVEHDVCQPLLEGPYGEQREQGRPMRLDPGTL